MWRLLNFKSSAHSNDIKAVCDATLSSNSSHASVQFLTASRDSSVKLWNFSLESGEFEEILCLEEHEGFINSLAFLKDVPEYPEGLIISGGSDKLINLWDCRAGKLCGTLIAHTGNICKLVIFKKKEKTFPYIFASTSWDGTALCWTEEFSASSCLSLKTSDDNSGSCWSMAAMGRDVFVTGHADRSIRIWRGDSEVQVIKEAHGDVVRDLGPLETLKSSSKSDLEFVSVGNDGAIKVWSVSTGNLIQNIEGAHPAYIYGLAICGNRMVSYGEGGIVKIWKRSCENFEFELESDLRVPMMSVWAVSFIKNEDENLLVVAGSSKSFYIFTNGTEKACEDSTKAFEMEIEEFNKSANASRTAEIEKNVQDSAVLKTFGSRLGQTVLIRKTDDSEVIEAHQWNGSKWQNLGQVLDPNNSTIKLSADFSFKVELDDTGRLYELNYNVGENPYVVSKEFLERNDLSMVHLDEVANFIVKNAGVESNTERKTEIEINEKNKDKVFSSKTLNNLTFKFEAYNSEGINSKLKSFGLDEISLKGVLKILISKEWPVNKLFPCLDFLRIEVLKGDIEEIERILKAVPFDLILENGKIIGASKETIAGVTMALRLLCNASAVTGKYKIIKEDLISKVIKNCINQEIDIMTTWTSLLIGLLYNVSSYLDSLKSLTFLNEILCKLNTTSDLEIKICDCHRIYEIIKSSSQNSAESMSLILKIKNEIIKLSNIDKSAKKKILELLQ